MKIATIIAIIRAAIDLLKLLGGIRDKFDEQTVEAERAKAEAEDHVAIQQEVNEWRKDS